MYIVGIEHDDSTMLHNSSQYNIYIAQAQGIWVIRPFCLTGQYWSERFHAHKT